LHCRGESRLASEWAEVSGVKRSTILMRLKMGWDVEFAIFTPTQVQDHSD
jgi:hypothetical protein